MALPRILKNFNVFHNGESYFGQCDEISLPALKRKTESWRGGGMSGEVELDLGNEKLEIEHTYGGHMRTILEQYGITKIDGMLLRFAGAYQREDTEEVQSIEIIVRGRHMEIDRGKSKGGDKTEFKVKSQLSYYKETINGQALIEIDLINLVEVVNGVDRVAEQRRAIGVG